MASERLRTLTDQRVLTRVRGSALESWLLGWAWLVVIAGVALWLDRTPNGELRDQLRRWQFWALETLALLLLALSWINLPRFVRSLDLARKQFAFPLAASALAFALATWVAPRTSRIYYDEQIYQSIGQNLSDLRLAQLCNDGSVEYGSLQCWRGEYNKEPYGYPYVLSALYQLMGVHEPIAFALNTVAAALLVWVVFLATTALTGRTSAGNVAALIVALIPEQLRWSHSASAEPTAALACAFAFLAALAFVRERSTGALLWMVVATAVAMQFRPECILIAPVVLVVLLLRAPDELTRRRFWWAGLFGLILTAAHVGHLVAVRTEGWGTTGNRLSTAYLASNLRVNGWFYLVDARFPVLYSVLALTGVILSRQRRGALAVAAYFLSFWGIFLFFYAGSYNYGADDRFSLMTYAPLAILAGMGSCRVAELLERGRRLLPVAPRGVILWAVALQFLWYLPFVRTIGEEAWGARADVLFAKAIARDLPRNSIVLTHNPGMFQVWGYSAAQASLAMEPGYVQNGLAPRYVGGVFFHWNFWCNVADPVQQSFCTGILDRFPHTLIQEYRERDYRYAIYRLAAATERSSDHSPGDQGR